MSRKSSCHFKAVLAGIFLLAAWSLTPTARAARPYGIDTSHWDGVIQWNSVYNAGYVFAFTKATESINYTDDTLAANMANARAAGVLIGCFHFARPEYGDGALAEANYFVDHAGQYMTAGYLRPVLDLESPSGLSVAALSTWVNTFCNRVKTRTGVEPLIYTGASYASSSLNSSVTTWDLWVAQWPFTPNPQTGQPSSITPWSSWAFWQYSGDEATVPGVSTACDLDVFNGTLAQLSSYVIGGVVTTPPGITQQPVNQSVVAGGTANFTVVATGSATLSHRWQKNNAYLSNGGHYSGSTTATLTITGADANDVASYRCVVTNAYGSATSSNATLAIAVGCAPGVLVNADFEGGNTSGVASGWTGYQRTPNPTTVWSIQTASPPTGGGLQYQQMANTSSTGGAGVRQDMTGCLIGATYTISGWMRGNSGAATCMVRCSPSASTLWATAEDLNPPQTYTGTDWTAFSGTVVATATTMTLWLDGQTGGSGLNKAECFDSVTVTCAGAAVPPGISQSPANKTIGTGGTVAFNVLATGSDPLSHRWQKNNAYLANGGHYSGTTTATLTITGADTNDAANYRCVVTNAFGSTNSAAASLTVTNANTPPNITQPPANQSVAAGGTASFTVLAGGSNPLGYQWQKNNTNFANGGHYSGSTTATLTISGADASDAANYRCVVTNAFGSTNSAAATLTLIVPNPCVAILNPDFETGFTLAGGGNVGNQWTEWEAAAGVAIGYDEPTFTHGGGHSQRIRVWGVTNTTSGGVFQRVPVTTGQLYTIGVWIYAGDNLSLCYLGVDPAGGISASTNVTWSSATTNVAWIQKTWTGTATENYLTVYYKVASADVNKRNGYFDDATPATATGPLQLVVQPNGSNLTLTWPECPGARLVQANGLSESATWTTVTNQPTVRGGQKSVTLTPTGSGGYFRLVLE